MVSATAGDQAGAMTENVTGTTAPPPGQPGAQPPPGWNTENLKDYRKLRRSMTDRKVAGVAGGLGRHLNVDPTILRVLFVVLVFFGGAGLLLYGALWLFVPEEGTENTVVSTSESTRNGLLIAVAVIAGCLALGDTWSGFWFPWPFAIAGLVVAAILLARDNGGSSPAPPYTGSSTPYGGSAPYEGQTPYEATTPSYAGPVPPAPPTQPQGGAPWYPPTPPAPPIPPRPRRRGPLLFGITLALVALALGILGLFDVSGASVEDAAYPALALGVIGVMLVVGAFWGRPGGLVALGLAAALTMAAFSIGHPTFDGDRDLQATPVLAADVEDVYDVPAGRIVLDLSKVEDLDQLDGRRIDLEANAGEIVVIVPEELGVDFSASVKYGGAIETPIGTRDGWNSSLNGHVGDDDAAALVDLEMDLQFGRIEVRQQ